jgi:hypothetical protein
MPAEFASFAVIITLAAVINGLGIVRWLTSFSDYLRRKNSLSIQHYWVFGLFAGFQFLLHILMWWSLWGVRGVTDLNFLMYVYLLAGPVLLYLGTSVLVANIEDDSVDLRTHYFAVRPTYSSVLTLLWLWAIFMSPVLRGDVAPSLPIFALFFLVALVQRIAAKPKMQGVLATVNWLLLVVFVGSYGMQLGGSAG